MRDVAILFAVVAGAILAGVLGDSENWIGDRVGLVVIGYLLGVFAVMAVWIDVRGTTRRRR